MPVLTICTNTKPPIKKTVVADNIKDLKTGGCAKLGLDEASVSHIVLKESGAEVDDDQVVGLLTIHDLLIFLKTDETLEQHVTTGPTNPGDANAIGAQQSRPNVFKPPPIQRPEFLHKMSRAEWRTTVANWRIYKQALRIPDTDLATQLYLCCDKGLQTAMLTKNPKITADTEESILALIQDISCRDTNPAVFRRQFGNMHQQLGEDVKNFANRLEQAALDCEFSLKCCSCSELTSYSEQQQRDQLMRGLSDEYLRKEAYARSKSYPKLSDMVLFLSELETSGKDMLAISQPNSHIEVDRIKSEYQKQKSKPATSTAPQHKKRGCKWCGKGNGNCFPRKDKCAGWSQVCGNCEKRGHITLVCKSSPNSPTTVDGVYLGTVQVNSMMWDPHIQKIVSCVPDKPRAVVKMTPHIADQDIRPKHKLPVQSTSSKTECLADSGAQICAAGPKLLKQLGCNKSNLLYSESINIKSASKQKIQCTGFLPVTLEWGGRTSIQPLYICPSMTDIFIGLTAMKALGIVPEDFLSCASLQSPKMDDVKDEIDSHNENCARQAPPCRPDTIPFEPTSNNIKRFQEWFLKVFSESAFNIHAQPLPTLSGPTMKIHLKPGAHLKTVHTPIPVPFHWKTLVKKQLDSDVAAGVLERVPEGTPTRSCSRMVIVQKRDGTPRRTVDLQSLNQECLRETHHTPSPFHLVNQIPPNMYKTILDAKDGYHSIALDEQSRDLTTFITEWGRYRYCRGPQGFVGTGDFYTRRTDTITQDFQDKIKCIDDTLLYTTSIENAFWNTFDFLVHCTKNGMTFNPSKFKFAQMETEFAGFKVKRDGIAPGNTLLEAIKDFPTPKNITGARSWYGLVNQVTWADKLQPIMEPFRELLQKGTPFKWTPELNTLFESSKSEILERVREGVTSFDYSRVTCLATDWSKEGIGFLLWQQYCSCPNDNAILCCPNGWKLIFAGSRSTTSAESRYSPIEGECLAIVWALERARMFVLGCPNLIVLTDHRPLINILNDRALDGITNPRLLRFKERTLQFSFSIQHRSGRKHNGPDAVSRYPIGKPDSSFLHAIRTDPTEDEIATNSNMESLIGASLQLASVDDAGPIISIEKVNSAGKFDTEYQTLINTIRQGFPDSKSATPILARPYWQMRHAMQESDDVVTIERRIIVPKPLRRQILENLHAAHQGLTGMKARAKHTVWWPNFNLELKNFLETCKHCQYMAKSQRTEPLILSVPPNYPFESVAADHFDYGGHKYLVIADRFTGWLEVFKGQTTAILIEACKDLFSRFGVPESFSSDGGPAFVSYEFRDFMKTWGITHRLSSVSYPQSNGRAELAVKSAKRIIADNTGPSGTLNTDRVRRALLQYKNTPLQDIGVSPAQLLYGRHLRDWTPSDRHNYKISDLWSAAQLQREVTMSKRNESLTERYNPGKKELSPLAPGTPVIVQEQRGHNPTRWSKTGTIVETRPHRQYSVKMHGSGRLTLRNRKFIRPIAANMTDTPLSPTTTPVLESEYGTTPPTPPAQVIEDPILDALQPEQFPEPPPLETSNAQSDSEQNTSVTRRSSQRQSRPPRRLSPSFHARQSYDP